MRKLIFLIVIIGVFLIYSSVMAKPTLTCDVPDPAVQFVTISGIGDTPIKVDVIDIEGVKVFEYDMSGLEPGAYTIFVTPGNDWEVGAPSAPLSFVRPSRLIAQSVENLRLNFEK